LIQDLAKTFQQIVPIFKPIIDLIFQIVRVIDQVFVGVLKVFLGVLRGILKGLGFEAEQLKSSMGAAARPTAYVGGAELGRQARLAAYSVGQAATREDRQLSTLEQIARDVDAITRKIVGTAEAAGQAVESVNIFGALRELRDALVGQRRVDAQLEEWRDRHRDILQGKQRTSAPQPRAGWRHPPPPHSPGGG